MYISENKAISTTDYYPFGAPLYNRGFRFAGGYRYGFNGKEDDHETVGTGNGTQDYGLRIYNPSLGRFLSVDPLTKKYPWYTPYQFAGNKPIQFIDLDGGEEKKPGEKNGNGNATSQAVDNTAAGKVPNNIKNYVDKPSSSTTNAPSSTPSTPSSPSSSKPETKPKAEKVKDAVENIAVIGEAGKDLPNVGKAFEAVGTAGDAATILTNSYIGITAPQGSKEETKAKEDVVEGIVTYLAPKVGIPILGEALMVKDVIIKPLLALPDTKEVHDMRSEHLRKNAENGDLRAKVRYEDYMKQITPWKPQGTFYISQGHTP